MSCGTDEFNAVLSVIQALQAKYNPVYVICGGDFNTDLSKNGSGHTQSFLQFCIDFNLECIYSCSNHVKFTYMTDMNKSTSIIDYFIVSKSLLLSVRIICEVRSSRLWSTSQLIRLSGQQCSHSTNQWVTMWCVCGCS